ncbi:MAG: Sec-independent protein translocase TatB [Actinobacteria bacterium]|nr:Sec-independent protein translocase TatB [Actinomycetota bacterium]MCG2801604.1 Sec-independent protein translocase TatB [Cellulomonas sp.]
MIGINGGEFLILLVIAAIVIGPERLPGYAEQLASFVRRGRVLLRDTRERVSSEFGDAGNDLDWEALDPRRYDPRRIVREALAEDLTAPAARPVPRPATTAATTAAAAPGAAAAAAAEPVPVAYDDEAT